VRAIRPKRPEASARAAIAPSGAPGPTVDGVSIVYAPHHDGVPDPGEVVWAWVPFEEDATQGKDRPVVVIGWDGPKLAAVPLTSKDPSHRRDESTRVPVGTGAWDRERRPSWADADRLLRFTPSEVRREGSALDRARFDAVVARVRQLHGW
jgi:hypothetical protein